MPSLLAYRNTWIWTDISPCFSISSLWLPNYIWTVEILCSRRKEWGRRNRFTACSNIADVWNEHLWKKNYIYMTEFLQCHMSYKHAVNPNLYYPTFYSIFVSHLTNINYILTIFITFPVSLRKATRWEQKKHLFQSKCKARRLEKAQKQCEMDTLSVI